MNWSRSPGLKINEDKPRKLSDDEIKDIIDSVPDLNICDTFSRNYNSDIMRKNLKKLLLDVEVCPSGINELKLRILDSFQKASIEPGHSLQDSGQRLGKHSTQDALNSFHSSGSISDIGAGVTKVDDALQANTSVKNMGMIIHLEDKTLNRLEAWNKLKVLKEINVSDCVSDFGIYSYSRDKVKKYWWSHTNRLLSELLKKANVNYEDELEEELEDELEDCYFLRLKLNHTEIYRRNLRVSDLGNSIKSASMEVFYGSTSDGVIDIMPTTDFITVAKSDRESTYKEYSIYFLKEFVSKNLDKIYISGVKGIREVKLEYKPYSNFFTQKNVSLKNNPKKWWAFTMEKEISYLSLDCLHNFKKGVEIYYNEWKPLEVKKTSKSFYIEVPETEKSYKDIYAEMSSDMQKSSYTEYTYCSTEGSAYQKLFSIQGIDKSNLYSNDIKSTFLSLGIEATAKNLLNALNIAIPGLNPVHALLIVSNQTIRGVPKSVSFHTLGQSGNVGPLTNSSKAYAFLNLTNAGIDGKGEDTTNAVAAYMSGNKVSIGTGYSDVVKISDTGSIDVKRKNFSFRGDVNEGIINKSQSCENRDIEAIKNIEKDIIEKGGNILDQENQEIGGQSEVDFTENINVKKAIVSRSYSRKIIYNRTKIITACPISPPEKNYFKGFAEFEDYLSEEDYEILKKISNDLLE